MIMQPRKWPGVVAAIVAAIFLIKNPVAAADAVDQVISAIDQFASRLGPGS